jgi:D-cysteine desulfhydrase
MLGRRGFLAGSGLLLGCTRREAPVEMPVDARPVDALPTAPVVDAASPPEPTPAFALFDAYPALAQSIPRIALGRFPSPIENARAIDERVWVKRDDDFTRSPSYAASFELARVFGGGKVRKLELFFGEARAKGKRRVVTSGGVGSNQALAVALLGRALGFAVRIHLAPQPRSSLTAMNLAADAASDAEMVLFDTVTNAHARAERDARENEDTYVIPPGGTTPLGTLGFVSAGLELAGDVRAGKMPAPARIYVALGLGGSTAGLGLGCALGGLSTEIVGVRTSTPATVTAATLRSIYEETIAFVRARDASFVAPSFAKANVRIDGRYVGGGYGVPTPKGDEAIARARTAEGWELDPVYTGKACAALLDDVRDGARGPLLFWNTMSSRPVARAKVPEQFARYEG